MLALVRRLLALASSAAFCLATAAAANAGRLPGTVPGTLRIAITTEPNSLDPVLQTQVIEGFIDSLAFDQLFETHADGSIEPQLAREIPTTANGGISRDGKTITIHLRPNVRWHDGKAVTTADVAFTQAAHLNPANDTSRSPFDTVERLDAPDPLTVVVHLKAPNAAFLPAWGVYAIVPAHLLAALPNLNNAPFNGAPVGDGPFVFDHWDRAHEIVFRANDAYYQGPPILRKIVIDLVPDENSAAVALRAHEVDMVYLPSASMRPLVAGDPGLRFLAFDVNGVEGIEMNLSRPPLDDRRVREAISLAIDRIDLVNKVEHGLGTPATGNIPAFTWAADPALKLQFDPPRSRALLRAAGWAPGSDGILTKGGRRLSLALSYIAGSGTEASATLLLQPMLRAVGIDLTLKAVQANVLFAPAAAGGLLQTGQFDLDFSGFYNYDDPDDSRRFLCSQRRPDGFNAMNWCDPAYDALAEAAVATYDRARRKAIYAKIVRLLREQAPVAFVWWPKSTVIVSVDLQHVVNPTHHDLADARFWDI